MREKRRWEVDPLGMARARDALGLVLPVETRYVGGGVSRLASYRLRLRGTPRHEILLQSDLDPRDAPRVVWHELGHAADTERVLGADAVAELAADPAEPSALVRDAVARFKAYQRRNREHPYAQRPSELEARAAESFSDEMPVTRTIGAVALKPWRAPEAVAR